MTSRSAYLLGCLGLAISVVASGMLAAEHLGWFSNHLPGCAPGSGCDSAAKSVFGRLPFDVPGYGQWSIAFAGFAFFISMLCTWLVVGLAVPRAVVWMARAGLIVSLIYIAIIMTHLNQYFCKYCAASHAGNLLFWAAAEFGASLRGPRPRGSLKAVASAAVVFAGVSFGLGAAEARAEKAKIAVNENLLDADIKAMQEDAQRQKDEAKHAAEEKARLDAQAKAMQDNQPAAPSSAPKPAPAAAAPAPAGPAPFDIGIPIPGDDTLDHNGFTGRYRLGPAKSSIRIVSFSDYQCPDCARVEKEIHALLKEKPYISFSHKHWAFCHTCNKYYTPENGKDMHPNSCFAAQAAEAAGKLKGNAGFWKMHFWMFEHMNNGAPAPGSFTQPELNAFLAEQGYDAAEFMKLATDPNSPLLANVKADIDEAQTAGIFFTPMIFVNGREFRGWGAVDGLKRYIEALEKTNPPVADAAGDQPVGKLEKQIEDWRSAPKANLSRNPIPSYPMGPENAKVRIVMYGDYRDQWTPLMWAELMRVTKLRADVSIEFRPRPVKETCNVIGPVPDTLPACWMSRAVESAGRIGGVTAFWKMHDWLMQQGDKFDAAMLPDGAKAAGLDPAALKADMMRDDMMNILISNYKTFSRAGGRGVPCVYINDRCVWRWTLDDNTPILDKIIDAAAQGK